VSSPWTEVIFRRPGGVFLLLLFALALRIIFGVVLIPDEYRTPSRDAAEYDRLGLNLAKGNGLKDEFLSHRMPLYPAFLALCYLIWGHSYVAVRLVQSLLGTLTCLFVYLAARRVAGDGLARIALFVAAVYPPLIRYSYFGGPAFLLSETLFIFFLSLGVLVLLLWWTDDQRQLALLAIGGLILGVAQLVRPVLLLAPVFVGLWLIIFVRDGRFAMRWSGRLGRAIIFAVCFLAPTVPWAVRNFQAHGAVILATTNGGAAFLGGNNSAARGAWVPPHKNSDLDPAELEGLGELGRDRRQYEKAWAFLRAHPERILWLAARKILIQFSPFSEVEDGVVSYNFGYGMVLPFVVLGALWGLVPGTRQPDLLIAAVLLALTSVAIVTMGDPRYRYPIEPLLMLFAARGLVGVRERLGGPVAVGAIVTALAVINGIFAFAPATAYTLAKTFAF